MELIIGGSYQGKHDYLAAAYPAIAPEQLLDNLHLWVRERLEHGGSPTTELAALLGQNHYLAVVCEDIFGGVVPLDPLDRRWREETGRCLAMTAAAADRVTRLFCGIATRIK